MVLDPCCGSRMMWFNPADQRVLFGDQRHETVTVIDRTHRADGTRVLSIHPDCVLDFRALPFADNTFPLVVFDPPHLVRAGKNSWLAAKYGRLSNDWRQDLRAGFAECFRVLRPEGLLVFKWSEIQVATRDVLALTDRQPLFGHPSGKRAGTHWITFMKEPAPVTLANVKPPRDMRVRVPAVAEIKECTNPPAQVIDLVQFLPHTTPVIDKLQDVIATHGFAVPARVISDAFRSALEGQRDATPGVSP